MPEDASVVRSLALPFAATAAAATVVATSTKASFLATHPISALPWVIAAQAVWSIASSLAFMRILRRASLGRRTAASLGAAALTLLALRAVMAHNARDAAFAAVLLGPAMVQLAFSQAWGAPAAMLPSRQAKRILPLLASMGTAGAAAGGALAGALGKALGAPQLLFVTAGLLLFAAATMRAAIAQHATPPDDDPRAAGAVHPSIREVLKLPLVARLALCVGLVQAGSVVLDVQFSGELRAAFDEGAMTSFLGAFYGACNVASLAVGLGATTRMVRLLGLGFCVACTAAAHLTGSAGYLALVLTHGGPPFIALAAASGLERIGQYAVGRSALAMAVAPLDGARQDTARTIVDIVAYRGATLLASAGLLLVGDVPLHALAPWAIAISTLALLLSSGIGDRYRRALYEALRGGAIDGVGYSRVVVDEGVAEDVTRALAAKSPEEIAKGLEVVKALGVPVPTETLVRLARSDDAVVVSNTLDAFEALERPIPDEVFVAQLAPDRPPGILRAVLAFAPQSPSSEVRARIEKLAKHEDSWVARLARATAAGRVQRTPFKSMLAQGGRETRIFAAHAMGHARAQGSETELIALLEDPELRAGASASLSRFGARLAPFAKTALDRGSLSHEGRIALLGALERTGELACRDVVAALAADPDARVRDACVEALFRMGKTEGLRPSRAWLHDRIAREIAELEAILHRQPARTDDRARAAFAAAQLRSRIAKTERRAILLLGLLYGRRQLHRAASQLHSKSPRARSAAVELLEVHVVDPAFRRIVRLVESADRAPAPAAPHEDRWLDRVTEWAEGGADAGLDAVLRMQNIELFAAIGAEALEPLARSMKRRSVAAGERIVAAGELPDALYVVTSGTFRVEVPGAPTVGQGECIGELGLLDGEKRSADVVAAEGAEVLVLDQRTFESHLQAHPTFARALLELVARRLREAVQKEEA